MFGKKLAGVTRSVGAIQSDKELAGATREVCDLISKGSLSSLDKKRFQTLVELIENYEEINHPIPEPSHAALLEHLLASRAGGVPRLAEVTGISRAVIRNILDGKR